MSREKSDGWVNVPIPVHYLVHGMATNKKIEQIFYDLASRSWADMSKEKKKELFIKAIENVLSRYSLKDLSHFKIQLGVQP